MFNKKENMFREYLRNSIDIFSAHYKYMYVCKILWTELEMKIDKPKVEKSIL